MNATAAVQSLKQVVRVTARPAAPKTPSPSTPSFLATLLRSLAAFCV